MNLLITGCAGFIASSVIDRIINNPEFKIIGLDNFDDMYPKEIKLDRRQ